MWMFSGLGYDENPSFVVTVMNSDCVIQGDF
jgi:hypothetical protein